MASFSSVSSDTRPHTTPCPRPPSSLSTAPSLALEVAELHVILAPPLLGKERAEGVELGLGRVPLAGDVHLVVTAVDEVRRDGGGRTVGACGRADKAQAHVALQRVAVGAAGGDTGQLAVAVDGLAPPRPQVQLCVMVLQNQHDEAARHARLALLHQSIAAHEVHVLQGERGVAERRENMRDRHIKTQLKLATSYLFWGNWIKVTNCVFKWQV